MSEPSENDVEQQDAATLSRLLYAMHTRAVVAEVEARLNAERRMWEAYARSEN
jgi:hypothetical protein